jgi:hypothetical protein
MPKSRENRCSDSAPWLVALAGIGEVFVVPGKQVSGNFEYAYVVRCLASCEQMEWRRNTEDVQTIVVLCAYYEVPVISYGKGSSVGGHVLAVQGGVSIDLAKMNRVLSIDAEHLTVTVEPGVSRKQLNEALRGTGLFLPIDRGADASIAA